MPRVRAKCGVVQKDPDRVFDRIEHDLKFFIATGKMSHGDLKIISFLSK